MIKKILKLNELKNSDSYIQINYSRGFKYIDKAGEILNFYSSDKKVPKYQMGIPGLVIEKPTLEISELKVSGDQFWCHFDTPANLGNVQRSFIEEFTKCHEVINPESLTRFGWRNYFVLEKLNSDDVNRILGYKDIIAGQIITGINLSGKFGDFSLNIELSPLRNSENKERAILFDLDIYTRENINFENIKETFDKMKVELENRIPDLVTKVIK